MMGVKAAFSAMFVACAMAAGSADSGEVDLSRAVVVAPAASGPEEEAVRMLIEEVEKRTQIRWERAETPPGADVPAILAGTRETIAKLGFAEAAASQEPAATAAEGYTLRVTGGKGPRVVVAGNDSRGVLFGVGRLLRTLRMKPGAVSVREDVDITSAPKHRLRGHQLGYRPKTNSYDAWTVPMWEQYIRDLAVFGTNAIELIPPRSDDAATSPHFPLPPMQMMVEMSRLADRYGMDVWIWYPAMDRDYSDAATVEFALHEWGAVFEKLPRIDAVFVPGGDPGHTRPRYLMDLLEKQTEVLHRAHPNAQMWVSPQSFNKEWMDEFLQILSDEEPEWLSGVVYGPQVRMSLPELRRAVPARYPIRRYPDITHSRQCQYPVPNWDVAFMLTVGREGINPRPTDEATIFRLFQDEAIGFLTYSEGCNDDVNKIVWSSLGWDPDADVTEILREYSRYFIGEDYADDFAQGLLALERNWRGPLITNGGVETTLLAFQAMERSAKPPVLLNWRFQQGLYRAYYDAYVKSRLLYETELEARALEALRGAKTTGSARAMEDATAILDRGVSEPVATDLRTRVFELGEALFQSIRMQLSVDRYQAIHFERGANLDTIDLPLNNRLWLRDRFAEIAALPTEKERLAAIDAIVNWTNPGPGGFYDDPGSLTQQPHLVPGLGFERDPAHLQSALIGYGDINDDFQHMPKSWWSHAESLIDAPLVMHYGGLDPEAEYKVRVVYGGDTSRPKIRLVADDEYEVHPFRKKDVPFRPVEFDIPAEATRDGELTLTWTREPGLGGNGRGCAVSEIWLVKK